MAVGALAGHWQWLWDFDGDIYEANSTFSADGDKRVLVVHLADIAGASSGSINTVARVLANHLNGQVISGIQTEFVSDEIAGSPLLSNSLSLTASATPAADIRIESYTLRGTFLNETGTDTGVVYQIPISVLSKVNGRTGAALGKGIMALEDTLNFTLDLSQFGDNARIFNFTPFGSPNVNVYGGDGAVRNHEYYNSTYTMTWGAMPRGRRGEGTDGYRWDRTRTLPNSGDWTATQSAPGQNISVSLNDVNTEAAWYPDFGNWGGQL